MKWNKRAKLTATATSALLFTLLLASCSNDNNNDNVNLPVNSPIAQEQTQQDNNNDNSDNADNSSQQNNEETTEPTSTPIVQDTNVYEVNGLYIGAIDNNSIEVNIDGEPVVFKLSDAFDYVISDFAEQSEVTIKYTKELTEDGNYVQNIVTAISNAK